MSRNRNRTLAGMKGELATFGIGIHPTAQVHHSATPHPGAGVLLLDRVADVRGKPEYCVHGYVHCVNCDEICYLGDQSSRLVIAGDAVPMCLPCGQAVIPPESMRMGRVDDHLRADGPH